MLSKFACDVNQRVTTKLSGLKSILGLLDTDVGLFAKDALKSLGPGMVAASLPEDIALKLAPKLMPEVKLPMQAIRHLSGNNWMNGMSDDKVQAALELKKILGD